ncbi:MAG: site-specific integrase [Chloroflexi bacterium]|nr:site-specific integrase [Chloroflexota bacterium]
MLDQLFSAPFAIDRWRSGLLGPYLDHLTTALSDLGYTPESIKAWLEVLRDLETWLAHAGLAVADLEERLVEQFLDDRLRRRRQAGKARYSAVGARVVYFLLSYLREQGVVASPRPSDPTALTQLCDRYGDYLARVRGLSPHTLIGYWPILRRFLVERFGDGPIVVDQVTPVDVSGFMLRYARASTPARARLMVSALRSFFRYLFQEGQTNTDLSGAVPTIRSWRLSSVPKYIDPGDVQRTIDGCDLTCPAGRRDRAMLLLIARLGLRVSEIMALSLDDIDWRKGVLTIHGKGLLHDRLPLPTDVGEALSAYLHRDRPCCDARLVFVRLRAPHRAFTNPSSISSIVMRALRRAGLSPPTKGAHLLRHSLATGMLRGGASMAEIGQVLRHRSPATTEIYAKVDIDGLRSIARPWPSAGGR